MPTNLVMRIHNKGSTEVGLQVEPSGEHYRIPAGGRADIYLSGPGLGEGRSDAGLLEVDHEPDLVTVFGWAEAKVEVRGVPLSPWPKSE